MAHGAADEHLVMAAVKRHGPQPLAHTVHRHHFPGDSRGPLNIVTGPGGNIPKTQLLRHAAAQQTHDLVLHIVLGEVGTVLLRQRNGHAARLPPWDNGDLAHRVLPRQSVHHNGMARLVIGSQLPLMLRDDPALFLRTGDDLDLRVLQILHGDKVLIFPCGQQRALVDEIFQIRAGKAGGAPSQAAQIHILRQRLTLGVDLQNFLPALDVRQAHIDLPVKAARTQQGRVQYIRPVRGSKDHHALIGGKAVHLHQKLIERLLPLIVSAAEACASLAAHGIDLVDEHNGRGLLFRLFKKVPDAACAHAHVQLHKVGAGNGQKAHAGLSGDSLGQQRLASARRAYQQYALGDSGAQVDILLGVLQKLHDLLKLRLFLIGAGHIVKRDLLILIVQRSDLCGAEFCHAVRPHAALRPDTHHVPHGAEHHRHHHVGQNDLQPIRSIRRGIAVGGQDARGLLLLYQIIEVIVKKGIVMDAAAGRASVMKLHHQRAGIRELEGLHLLLLKKLHHLVIGHLVLPVQGCQPANAQKYDHQQRQNADAGSFLSHWGHAPPFRFV